MSTKQTKPAVDLSGKVVLVTGGNTGLGYATAKSLAIRGAHTIITCRSEEKATVAIGQMKEELGKQYPDKSINLEWMLLDLGSFRSTKDFTVAFKERNLPLHVLINNAGVATVPFALTEDGHETHLQVNHLSHLLLTLELLPIIVKTASTTGDGRIVFVSSDAHRQGTLNVDNLDGQVSYWRFKMYGNSKLFNVMTAYGLQRRLQQHEGITVSSLHPGAVQTDIFSKMLESYGTVMRTILRLTVYLASFFMKDPEQGCAAAVNCASNPELNSQQALYYDSDCSPVLSSETSRDEAQQEELWEISISMIKEFLTPELMQRYGPTLLLNQDNNNE